MDGEVKKIIFNTFVGISSIIGFGSALAGMVNFVEDFRWRIIIILILVVIVCAFIAFRFSQIIQKNKKEITDLKSNNSGLIEAKNNYLSENTSLKQDISKHQQDMLLLIGDNNKFRDIFNNITAQILKRDLGEENQEEIFDLILGGNKNGTKELEGYKDNR